MRNISDEAIKALYKHVMENAGSGNANVVEISETEYANLSDKEKNNGTIYFVYDDSEEPGNSQLNPYVIELSQEAYDALPEEEKISGKLFFISEYISDNIVKATDMFGNMTVKGEIQSIDLPASGEENDFYYLLDKCEGRYYKDGKWYIVR